MAYKIAILSFMFIMTLCMAMAYDLGIIPKIFADVFYILGICGILKDGDK